MVKGYEIESWYFFFLFSFFLSFFVFIQLYRLKKFLKDSFYGAYLKLLPFAIRRRTPLVLGPEVRLTHFAFPERIYIWKGRAVNPRSNLHCRIGSKTAKNFKSVWVFGERSVPSKKLRNVVVYEAWNIFADTSFEDKQEFFTVTRDVWERSLLSLLMEE